MLFRFGRLRNFFKSLWGSGAPTKTSETADADSAQASGQETPPDARASVNLDSTAPQSEASKSATESTNSRDSFAGDDHEPIVGRLGVPSPGELEFPESDVETPDILEQTTPSAGGPSKRTTRPLARTTKVVSSRERTLIVGVDFGTSSTKVIWQDLTDNTFEAFTWPGRQGPEESLLLPSTVTLRDGVLHFGLSSAQTRVGDLWLHSIKLCLLCSHNASICRCHGGLVENGLAQLPHLDAAQPASTLACLFLSNVFRIVESGLHERYPNDQLVLIWNIGCPMDHLDKFGRRLVWEKMAGTAMTIRQRVTSPCDVRLMAEATELMETIVVPPLAERNFVIQPEGLASVKAFLESPQAEDKTYVIVDVGAGTTEVSCFFNGRAMNLPGQPFRPSYLFDSTEPVGGGKIDQELAEAWGCEVEAAKERKEKVGTHLPALRTVAEISRQYRRTLDTVNKERKLTAERDMRFDLFVIGGGARLSAVKDALSDTKIPAKFAREAVRQLKPPHRLKRAEELGKGFDVIANACGLASSLQWEYYAPSEVDPIEKPAASPNGRMHFGECYEK